MIQLYSCAAVARTLGVTKQAVSNWLNRYEDTPAPYAIVVSPGTDSLAWTQGGLDSWVKWHNKRST